METLVAGYGLWRHDDFAGSVALESRYDRENERVWSMPWSGGVETAAERAGRRALLVGYAAGLGLDARGRDRTRADRVVVPGIGCLGYSVGTWVDETGLGLGIVLGRAGMETVVGAVRRMSVEVVPGWFEPDWVGMLDWSNDLVGWARSRGVEYDSGLGVVLGQALAVRGTVELVLSAERPGEFRLGAPE
jgi:hypothetical protein